MHSGNDAEGVRAGDEGGGGPNQEVKAPYSTETRDQPAVEGQSKTSERGRGEEEPQRELFEEEASSNQLHNALSDDSEPRPQQTTTTPGTDSSMKPHAQGEEEGQRQRDEGVPLPPPSAFGDDSERNEALLLRIPWWAGAFGAAPEMRDSPEARGFYARRFCEIFFPDNTAGATGVRRGGTIKFLRFVEAFINCCCCCSPRTNRTSTTPTRFTTNILYGVTILTFLHFR